MTINPSEQEFLSILNSTAKIDVLTGENGAFAAMTGSQIIYMTHGGALSTLLSHPAEKRCYDSKMLHRYALQNGVKAQNITFDAKLAAYLINPSSTDYSLSRLFGEYSIGAAADSPLTAISGFSALCDRLFETIKKQELMTVLYDIELPLSHILAAMEEQGFCLDAVGLRSYGDELNVRLNELISEIYSLAGGEFNLNSPKQLGEVLFERLMLPVQKKTKSGYSTDAQVLSILKPFHPIIEKILEYRTLAKLISTYVEGLIAATAEDGRIHTSFNQTETRTGRISSTEPNLQNIPIRTELGSQIRRFFTAPEGYVLIDADYSQIELRVLAHISADENMCSAFKKNEDIHQKTAREVFGVPDEEVTSEFRRRAKAVNFGIVYGIGAYSLSEDIGVSVKEAAHYIEGYLATYPKVAKYMEDVIQNGRRDGYVTTMFGRRRYLPELSNSNKQVQALGERLARNTPIQGAAADIIKLAMIKVHERLERENLPAALILQVHDELMVEAKCEHSEYIRAVLKEEMERACDLLVELSVSTGEGKNWYEAH